MALLEKSFQYAYQNLIPIMATIELTKSCNFRCSHCYNFDRTDNKAAGLNHNKIEIDSKRLSLLIRELHELGSLIINFTGGEVSLSPNLEQGIELTKQLNMEPRIKSNGSLLTKKRIQNLKAKGLSGADISIYGFSEKTYFSFTQNEGGFKKTLQGIQNVISSGIETVISIILHRGNVHELDEMLKFCESNHLQKNISIEITDRYDGSEGARLNEITAEQFQDLLKGPYAAYFEHENLDKSLQCSCARSIIGIASNGDIYPCIGAPIYSGNIYDQSLRDVWEKSAEFLKIRGLKTKDYQSCQGCNYIESCQRSSGTIYINTGDYTGCEPSTYKQAKIRHELKES